MILLTLNRALTLTLTPDSYALTPNPNLGRSPWRKKDHLKLYDAYGRYAVVLLVVVLVVPANPSPNQPHVPRLQPHVPSLQPYVLQAAGHRAGARGGGGRRAQGALPSYHP